MPHSSAHRPTKLPVVVAVNSNWLSRTVEVVPYGMTSRLNRNSGTQNEWMTSSECSTTRTLRLTGMTRTGISFCEPTVDRYSGPPVRLPPLPEAPQL